MPALTCGNQVGSAAPSATPPIQCLYLHILTPGCLPSDTHSLGFETSLALDHATDSFSRPPSVFTNPTPAVPSGRFPPAETLPRIAQQWTCSLYQCHFLGALLEGTLATAWLQASSTPGR